MGGNSNVIQNIATYVINFVKRRQTACLFVGDSFVLKMHYQYTFWMWLFTFSAVTGCWYQKDVIYCASLYSIDSVIRADHLNLCMSYPFKVEPDGTHRYLVGYRFIHWAVLVLAAMYYLPRKLVKKVDTLKVRKTNEFLCVNESNYDNIEKECVERAARYFRRHCNTHNGIYYKHLMCCIVSFIVDVTAFFYLDFLLQGRFLNYGSKSFPYNRDPENMSDYMTDSMMPFVKCEINSVQKLIIDRSERFGCHLVLMEMYEKIFLFVWFWLIVLSVITILYTAFIILMSVPYIRKLLLRAPSSTVFDKKDREDKLDALLRYCLIGDVFVLYKFKQHMSKTRFNYLLHRLDELESEFQTNTSMENLHNSN